MSLTAISTSANAFDFTATFAPQQRTASSATSKQAVVRLSFSEDSVEIDAYSGPIYPNKSIGISGTDCIYDGVRLSEMPGTVVTSPGCMTREEDSTLDLSYSYSENGQKKTLDLRMGVQEDSLSLLSPEGKSSASVAEQVLEASLEQSSSGKETQPSHLGNSYDATV